jgi:hypothetical protein
VLARVCHVRCVCVLASKGCYYQWTTVNAWYIECLVNSSSTLLCVQVVSLFPLRLHKNNGYTCDGDDCDDLNLPILHALDPRVSLFGYMRQPTISLADIISWATQGWAPIIHLPAQRHFVLVTGYFVDARGRPNGTLITRDSFYPRLTREYAEIGDVLVYSWNATARQ